MTESDALTEWFAEKRGSYVDVIIAGRVFGGRHGESPQQPQACEFDGSALRIGFGTTEQLIVDQPSGFQRGRDGELVIPYAARAVFGWHYYGRKQTPENWCEEIYEVNDGRIQLTRRGPLMPGVERFAYSGTRFVELL